MCLQWLITQFTHRVLLPVIFHLMINLFSRLNVYSFSIHVLLFCFNLKTCFIKKASTAAALSSDWPDCCQHVAAEHSELFFSYQLIKWLWWNTSNAFNHSGGTLRAHYAQLFTHFCITVGTQQLLAKSLCDHWHGEVIQTTSLPPTITWFCVNLLLHSRGPLLAKLEVNYFTVLHILLVLSPNAPQYNFTICFIY